MRTDPLRRGYLFLTDQDARPEYGSDPRVNIWDDDWGEQGEDWSGGFVVGHGMDTDVLREAGISR